MVCGGSAPQVRHLLYSGDAADLKQIGREFRFSDLAHVWRQRPETIDPNLSRVDRDRAGLRGRTHDAIWRARREALNRVVIYVLKKVLGGQIPERPRARPVSLAHSI